MAAAKRREHMISYTLHIEGMACGMCEAHICDTIRRICPEARKLAASHTKAEAVFLAEHPVDEAALRAAVDATGYRLTSVHSAPYEKKRWFGRK